MLIAQEVDKLNAGDTALRFLPMGAIGFIVSLGTGKLLEYMNGKHLLIVGLVLAVVAPISSCLTSSPEYSLYVSSPHFWKTDTNCQSWLNVLPTSLISISSVSFIFVTTSTVVLTSVPVEVKSLAGGMVSFSLSLPNSLHILICSSAQHRIPNWLWCRIGCLSRCDRCC